MKATATTFLAYNDIVDIRDNVFKVSSLTCVIQKLTPLTAFLLSKLQSSFSLVIEFIEILGLCLKYCNVLSIGEPKDL